ncbi:MAG TPA: glycogen debranching protein, partial [Blastocatellia bacterium]|nr:glycogen debranching protein [Blastocatellia bacterium]
MIDLDRKICSDAAEASSREWLETNGIGGFASGTVAGIRTRRYHALLTAATRPPLGRISTLSKYEETLIVGGERFELSANRYPGKIHPEGFRYLTSFRLDPFPVWTYEAGGVVIEKRLFMPHGQNAVV